MRFFRWRFHGINSCGVKGKGREGKNWQGQQNRALLFIDPPPVWSQPASQPQRNTRYSFLLQKSVPLRTTSYQTSHQIKKIVRKFIARRNKAKEKEKKKNEERTTALMSLRNLIFRPCFVWQDRLDQSHLTPTEYSEEKKKGGRGNVWTVQSRAGKSN